MIAMIDYGVGNLFSLYSSFKRVGADIVVTSDKKILQNADKIILPGVGAFADAITKLRQSGLEDVLRTEMAKGKYVMGICLGMQLLFEQSHEYGVNDGLGVLKGEVVPMKGTLPPHLKVPHVGWNRLYLEQAHPLFQGCKEDDFVYFVHSYHAVGCEDSLLATTDYGKRLTAAVGKENVLGCQFHPEKSGEVGLRILQNFCQLKD